MNKFIAKVEVLSLDFFINLAYGLEELSPNNQLLTTYGPMLEFAQRAISKFDKTMLVGLAHMAYGWMPTMIQNIALEGNPSEWKKQITKGCVDGSFLSEVTRLTNDSIVGASKLLHFVNPKLYPIYDSRVYKTILGKPKHNLSKDINNYISYTNKLRSLVMDRKNITKISRIKKELVRKNFIPAKCSKIRVLEVCLYASADSISSK